jgi:peptidoglycan/xylan/chitin deacetylase (PgdA/CDA1 family)
LVQDTDNQTGGIWRLYQLLAELDFTFSLIACGRSAELAPAVVTEAVNMGAEIVASGYRYVLYEMAV